MAIETEPRVTTTWNLDPVHSTAHFKVRHMMISNVTGEFTVMAGTLHLDSTDITKSTLEASVDVSSINTKELQQNAHLKSADFLDAKKFPELHFRSTRISTKADGNLTVFGKFTIHGISREVVLQVTRPNGPIKDPYGNVRLGISAAAHINRKDYGLEWNATLEAGGVLVGEEISITLELEFVRT
jgi:polyisoprenoid-binding protein YceI